MQTGLVGMPKHENENHPTQELKVTVDALVYVLAFLQGLFAFFYLDSALHMQKIQITIRNMGDT